jgi:regulator of cell morphogenesis and NO signaling
MQKEILFGPNTRMADIIHTDYRLIPIIDRFGIDYGFKNKTVHEVCEEYGVNVWFFLEILNSCHDENYFPQEQLKNFDSTLIIDYLSRTHVYYLESWIPEIQAIIDEMEEKVADTNSRNVKLLNDFFKEYKKELELHLEDEDKNVFPYILKLEAAEDQGVLDEALRSKIREEPIETYESNHSNMEVKLGDLKNLIIMHLPPVLCKELRQKLLIEIFRLEADLNNHARIEDLVLVPKVKQLEQETMKSLG